MPALSPDQAAAIVLNQDPPPQGPNGRVPAPRQERRQTYQRREFLNEERTGNSTYTREEVLSEEFEFSPELKGEYKRFLKDYGDRLLTVSRLAPNVLENPAHRSDNQLLTLLLEQKKNAAGNLLFDSGRNPTYEITDAKVEELLSTSRGWTLATMAMERQMALQMFALGVRASFVPPGVRETMMQSGNTFTGMDQGALSRLWENAALPWLTRPLGLVAGRMPVPQGLINQFQQWHLLVAETAASGVVFAGNLLLGNDPIQAGLAAGVIPGMTALYHMFRPGVVLEARQYPAALQAIQNSPGEAAYLRAMADIDISDLNTVTPPGAPPGTPPTGIARSPRVGQTINVRSQEQYLKEKFATRNKFYREIGIRSEDLDATPEQFLTQYMFGQQEELNTKWQARFQREFNPNAGGIRDRWGQRPDNPWFGRAARAGGPAIPPPGTPAFDGVNLDNPGNLRRLMTARERTMFGILEQHIEEGLGARTLEGDRTAIQRGIDGLGEGGTIRTARRTEITRRTEVLTRDRGAIHGDLSITEQHRTGLASLDQARRDRDRELTATLVGAYPTTRDALTALRAVLHAPGANITLTGGRVINSIRDRQNTIDVWLETQQRAARLAYPQLDGETPEAYGRRIETVDANLKREYDSRVAARIQPDVYEINRIVTRLETLENNIQTAQEALGERTEGVRNTNRVTDTLQRDYATLTGWPGITQARLRTETIDQLMARINTANAANNARGWNAAQNGRPEMRARVLRAMIEARAREQEVELRAPNADFTALAGWNISENQLRNLDVEQLFQLVNDENARNPANGWAAAANNAANRTRVENAIRAARARFNARHSAIEERVGEINELANRETFTLEEVDRQSDREGEEKRAALQIVDRRGEVGAMTELMLRDITRRRPAGVPPSRFVDITALAAGHPDAGQYTQAEIDAGQAIGYYEILDLLFDYKRSAPNGDRNTYFQTLQRLLPPAQLAMRLNNKMGLGLPPAALGLGAVLAAIQTRAGTAVQEQRLGRGLNEIMVAIIERGKAI